MQELKLPIAKMIDTLKEFESLTIKLNKDYLAIKVTDVSRNLYIQRAFNYYEIAQRISPRNDNFFIKAVVSMSKDLEDVISKE